MIDDPFQTWDAAYVLGALSPEERQTYERHLRECPRCAAAVRDLGGIPGLLARVPLDRVLAGAVQEPPPTTMLPGLLTAVRRQRRRSRWMSTGATLAAAACLVALAVVVGVHPRTVPGSPPAALPAGPTAPAASLEPLGAVPLTATASLTDVAWGTRVDLRCSYLAGQSAGGPAREYSMVVVDRQQRAEQVGNWTVSPGADATLSAATHLRRTDIAAVEVRGATGTPVLRLSL